MPTYELPIPDMDANISRPVAMQVAREMASQAMLPSTLEIRYKGDGQALAMPGSTMDDVDRLNRYPGEENIQIDVSDDYIVDDSLRASNYRPEQIPFFVDRELDVYLKAAYQRVQTTITVKYVAADKTTVGEWIRVIKRRIGQMVSTFEHVLNYHYPIPIAMMASLMEIYNKREATAGYGESFADYLKKHFTPRFTVIANQAGGLPTFSIREEQVGIQGWYEFGGEVPKKEPGDAGTWSISFNYVFSYDRCENAVMEHPFLIHNTLIDYKYFSREQVFDPSKILRAGPHSVSVLERMFTFEARNGNAKYSNPGISIPWFDTWLPTVKKLGTVELLRMMIQLNPANLKEIVSINNLGSWRFSDAAYDYMMDTPGSMTKPYQSVFILDYYNGNKLIDEGQILVTKDLAVMCAYDQNLRVLHHLVMSLVYEPFRLTNDALVRLARHGTFAREYLHCINPRLTLPPLRRDGSVALPELRKQVAIAGSNGRLNNANAIQLWALVGAFVIRTEEKQDAVN